MEYQVEEKETLEQFQVLCLHEEGFVGYEYQWAYSKEEAEQKLLSQGFGVII